MQETTYGQNPTEKSCDIGKEEAIVYVILECEKYATDRKEMMRVILT